MQADRANMVFATVLLLCGVIVITVTVLTCWNVFLRRTAELKKISNQYRLQGRLEQQEQQPHDNLIPPPSAHPGTRVSPRYYHPPPQARPAYPPDPRATGWLDPPLSPRAVPQPAPLVYYVSHPQCECCFHNHPFQRTFISAPPAAAPGPPPSGRQPFLMRTEPLGTTCHSQHTTIAPTANWPDPLASTLQPTQLSQPNTARSLDPSGSVAQASLPGRLSLPNSTGPSVWRLAFPFFHSDTTTDGVTPVDQPPPDVPVPGPKEISAGDGTSAPTANVSGLGRITQSVMLSSEPSTGISQSTLPGRDSGESQQLHAGTAQAWYSAGPGTRAPPLVQERVSLPPENYPYSHPCDGGGPGHGLD